VILYLIKDLIKPAGSLSEEEVNAVRLWTQGMTVRQLELSQQVNLDFISRAF
jgi:hypothetical protein